MYRIIFALPLILAALVINVACADYLEVRRAGSVKAEPAGNAAALRSVEPGEILLLVTRQQTNGYYEVRLPANTRTGWFHRNFGRGFPGDPPGELPDDLLQVHVKVGKPTPYYELFREGYAVGYDARMKVALWVQYQLTPEHFSTKVGRTEDFRPDLAIPVHARSANSDFDELRASGSAEKFAKGHMAPANDMARTEQVMSESFFLTNMIPQVGPTFNSTVWARLERDVTEWVKHNGPATVITGPVFRSSKEGDGTRVNYRVIGKNEVAVPTHVYKIVLDNRDPASPRALAFLMANRDYQEGESYKDSVHSTSIDEIESLTGLDFLSELDDDRETILEAAKTTDIWLSERE